jgi:Spy/CpxP family protein refolding chaperone
VNSWKVILATLIIYSAGVLSGALALKALGSRRQPAAPPPAPEVFQGPDFVQQRFLDRMKKELDLTTDQSNRLAVVFRDSRERMKVWWDIIGPEMRAEMKDVREKIQTELNPTQREKFEKLLKDRRHPPGQPPGDRHPRGPRPPGSRNQPRSSNEPPPTPSAQPAAAPSAGGP